MQQQGGSQYGVPPPEMAPPFSSAAMIGIPAGVEYLQQQQQVAEAASPINSRPAPPQPALPRQQVSIFDDFGSGGGAMVRSFPDEEALGAGEDTERGGGGNRWPRQETLALLKIRSDMDAVFRDATLKGPLWEDVSRKLAELGYARSAKKCKEKFENVHKYYKRTKEGRAGRQDGKSYRFFTQLEALHSSSGGSAAAVTSLPSPPSTVVIPNVITSVGVSTVPQHKISSSSLPAPPESTMTPAPPVPRIQPPAPVPPPAAAPAPPSRSVLELSTPAAVVGISFSSNTSSSSASESDGEETEEGGVGALHDAGRKRKREGWPGGTRKMMAFFDGLMKQVMERQEAMQQRFLETIEKREQDRMIREEAWKRQEMARLNREYELMAQERTMAANRDAAVISFLQKFTGIQANQPLAPPISADTPPEEVAAPPPASPQDQLKPPAPLVEAPAMQIEINNNQLERNDLVIYQPTSSSEPAAAASEMADGMCVGSIDTISPSSSRWPKPEVLALIKLRSGLESRYLESGPKGPLWEEISLGMKRLGYSRNAKRCKEKWENINKYFKKVKESNKKRPEDAKTCPYFHELDALYRKKQLFGGGGAAANPGIAAHQTQELAITPKIGESFQNPAPITGLTDHENNKGQRNPTTLMRSSVDGGNHESSGVQIPRSNGTGLPQLFFGGAQNRGSSTTIKKPEDFVRELMGQQNLQHRSTNDYDKLAGGETADSDTINHEYEEDDEDNDDEDEEDDEEDGKLRYEIQFQRQGVGAGSGPARGGNSSGKVPATAASSAGSFLAMVQ